MKILLEKHREFNVEAHIAFVDLKKAINRVNRTKLLEFLQNDKICQQIIQNIYNLYKSNLILVKAEDIKSELKVSDSGDRQGCRFPPQLFIRNINALIKKWRQKPHVIIHIGRNLQIHITLFEWPT
jgi:hypothetical protein